MTEKQRRFCDFYIESGNATESAKKAGYSAKTAKAVGSENLTKPYLRDYIDARLEELESARIASADEVLQLLTKVLRGEETEQVLRSMGESGQEFDEKPPSIKDRLKAGELLAKRYGILTDRVALDAGVVVISGADALED